MGVVSLCFLRDNFRADFLTGTFAFFSVMFYEAYVLEFVVLPGSEQPIISFSVCFDKSCCFVMVSCCYNEKFP